MPVAVLKCSIGLQIRTIEIVKSVLLIKICGHLLKEVYLYFSNFHRHRYYFPVDPKIASSAPSKL
ncbi:hypothetical protein BpHYR1_014311 [Brachionus plicatilis]|uniref:Uncharacterized protein n=1 Tax=Brachionus plicatilis TaxID=10195 RepID=A0A3M7RP58_BRAPC|nr:hypothetical protein BpHYR1_014311 [Brachionus plicatilis]